MKRYLPLLVLLAAGAVGATPMHSSREKPNALGFHQHQPKSSLHGYASTPLVPDVTSRNDETSTTDEARVSTPPAEPGRVVPGDTTDRTKTPHPPPAGRIEPATGPPDFCATQGMVGSSDRTPWGCAIKGPRKELLEPGTCVLLAIGLMVLWLQRVRASTKDSLDSRKRRGDSLTGRHCA